MYYSVKCMHLPFNHCNIKADATTSMFVFICLTNHNLYSYVQILESVKPLIVIGFMITVL